MPKPLISLLLLVLAMAGGAQTASELDAPAVQRVAKKLLCSCGCKLDMTCLMPPGLCHVCQKGKAKIHAMQTQGLSDQTILHQFAREEGSDILVRVPGAMGTLGPYLVLVLGLAVVLGLIRKYRRQPEITAPDAPDTTAMERIEKHLAGLDL